MSRTTTYTTPGGRATRDQLVRAAMETFAARGYRGASLDTIAAEVGVTRQGLLHYFPSKTKLLLAVLQLRDEEDAVALNEFAAREGTSVRQILGELLRHNATRPGLGRLFTVLSAESIEPGHPAHEYFVERYRRVRELFIDWIRAEQASGRITSAPAPESLAVSLIALLDGLQLQALLDPESVNPEQALDDLLAVLGAQERARVWAISITIDRSSWRIGKGVSASGPDSSPHGHTPTGWSSRLGQPPTRSYARTLTFTVGLDTPGPGVSPSSPSKRFDNRVEWQGESSWPCGRATRAGG
jgi:AcrR family transcriptional regulator